MNRITRNVAVVLFGAVTSVLTAAVLLFLEARSGQSLFGYALWAYVPVGSVGAGFLGALGYLGASLALRIRPANILLPAIALISAFTVFVVQSAETGLFMAGKGATASLGAFTNVTVSSVAHSQLLKFGSSDSGSSDNGSASPSAPGAASQLAPSGGASDESVSGIGTGVSGMLAAPDVTNSAPARRLNEVGGGIDSIGSGVKNHGNAWLLMALQAVGFALGGLAAFTFLRGRTYCDSCDLFLSKKGDQTRYFRSSQGVHTSVGDFLDSVKSGRLRDCIKAHFGEGTKTKDKFVEYSSTIEVRRCTGCDTHRLNFSAQRKQGGRWKEMPVLAHTAFSMEPIDIMRV